MNLADIGNGSARTRTISPENVVALQARGLL